MKLTYYGTTLTLEKWALVVEINPNTLRARKNRGMTDVEALTTPVLSRRQCARRSGWKHRLINRE